ncbi:hypothetical protein OIU34_29630 [Pararhizobium sp. BT-229]|uniref:hypothetical protein n=1 Tax=Pararhizobium sp. BT-229 TaxID=2986923 RepID=UPI0021F7EBB3|nr:hypothetical protein [Pararhizobium sp. BT-229]MCV9966036.1 hypothetical protein [Pararhizobium sp. BT-229]
MSWLKAFVLNIVALVLAAGIGTIATSQVVYVHEIPTGALPIAPLFRGFVVSVIVAAIAPSTRFGIRFAVFAGIYLLDLALSVVATAAVIELVNSYFDGDGEAAKPWTYTGAVIPLITGVAGFYTLRLYRTQPSGLRAWGHGSPRS